MTLGYFMRKWQGDWHYTKDTGKVLFISSFATW